MNVAIFHGSPRKGNTYKATTIFVDELKKHGNVYITEFFLPKAMPEFCTGCQLCLSSPSENCPHAEYVKPVLAAIMESEALVFATPHYGACSMSGAMKNLLDHLDFLTMSIAPRKEVFSKKAFIISTGSGSAKAIKPIKKYLINWGINRINSLGIKMFTNKWDSMAAKKQLQQERRLRKASGRFYAANIKTPYLSAVFMYHMSKFILKRYIGEGNYPFEYWKEQGFFKKRPF
jgi:multimeric flavodoxin WrbA